MRSMSVISSGASTRPVPAPTVRVGREPTEQEQYQTGEHHEAERRELHGHVGTSGAGDVGDARDRTPWRGGRNARRRRSDVGVGRHRLQHRGPVGHERFGALDSSGDAIARCARADARSTAARLSANARGRRELDERWLGRIQRPLRVAGRHEALMICQFGAADSHFISSGIDVSLPGHAKTIHRPSSSICPNGGRPDQTRRLLAARAADSGVDGAYGIGDRRPVAAGRRRDGAKPSERLRVAVRRGLQVSGGRPGRGRRRDRTLGCCDGRVLGLRRRRDVFEDLLRVGDFEPAAIGHLIAELRAGLREPRRRG